MKFTLFAMLIFSSAFASAGDITRFAFPDHRQPNCVATPAELARHSQAWAAVGTFGGLDKVVGTWKLTGIPFKSQLISFSYNANNFIVQIGDDFPEEASLCAVKNTDGEQMLRIAIHTPGCPEHRNIFVRSTGEGEMSVSAYATRLLGSVTFTRKSPEPQPRGVPHAKTQCVLPWPEESKH